MDTIAKPNGDVRVLIEAAYTVSRDVGIEVEEALAAGRERGLETKGLATLVRRIVTVVNERASLRGETLPFDGETEEVVARLLTASGRSTGRSGAKSGRVELHEYDGIKVGPVFPRPIFHGHEVPMTAGFVRTRDIDLWEGNERLEIHVAHFQQKHDRKPDPQELLDLMLSNISLPGITKNDQFEIKALARSIATNGVRKPPIIDLNGTLLDGNRRVTACHYILNSDEFNVEAKRRAEWVYVWQLTEHATPDDRERVVVALNFEPDFKKDWPEYIKARKIHQEWEAMLRREKRPPNNRRQTEMKRALSVQFALGPAPTHVTRYLKMMEWADQFEAFQVEEQGRDAFEVKHRAEEAFQYFEELGKGIAEGGVAHTLNQDEPLRHAVFDLLFGGRFKNWSQIRDLKYIGSNEEARELLLKARHETDADEAEEKVEQAVAFARSKRAEERKVGVNTRIETFVKWLLDMPVGTFTSGELKPENLRRLLKALERVQDVVAKGLEAEEADRDDH